MIVLDIIAGPYSALFYDLKPEQQTTQWLVGFLGRGAGQIDMRILPENPEYKPF